MKLWETIRQTCKTNNITIEACERCIYSWKCRCDKFCKLQGLVEGQRIGCPSFWTKDRHPSDAKIREILGIKKTKDVELNLDREVLVQLTLEAHELNITLNQHIVNIMHNMVEQWG